MKDRIRVNGQQYKYDGLLIHQSFDELGVIEVIDKQGVRSLHLGSHHRQSSMSLKTPQELFLEYVRAMLGCLLFRDKIDELLMVGLGGGTLAKYFLHHFDNCRIKVIEYRPDVVKIAHRFFDLPLDPRLKVHIDDGGNYICKSVETLSTKYGLLFVDAFDEKGISTSVHNLAFFDACKSLLQDDGIMVLNLWGSDKALFEQCAWQLGKCFDWKILFLPVRGRGNIIAFAFADGVEKQSLKTLKNKATVLEQQFQIEFPVFVTDIRKNNKSVLYNVVTK